MTDNNKSLTLVPPPPPEEKSNVFELDKKRFDKLKDKPYFAILDEAELLRLKFQSNTLGSHYEAYRFVTLVKYMIQFGHSEAIKYSYQLIYDQFMKGL